MTIKKNEEIWGIPFPVSGEWDAGYTPLIPGVVRGRFTARRKLGGWEVVFQPLNGDPEQLLGTFPPAEDGEIQAKNFAVEKLQEFWIQVN